MSQSPFTDPASFPHFTSPRECFTPLGEHERSCLFGPLNEGTEIVPGPYIDDEIVPKVQENRVHAFELGPQHSTCSMVSTWIVPFTLLD